MSWHTINLANLELLPFTEALQREYRRELSAGRKTPYRLHIGKMGDSAHVVIVPPEAHAIFEHLPSWKPRLRLYEGTPDLASVKVLSVL